MWLRGWFNHPVYQSICDASGSSLCMKGNMKHSFLYTGKQRQTEQPQLGLTRCINLVAAGCNFFLGFMYIVYASHDLPGDHRAVYMEMCLLPISFMTERPHVAVIWIKSASELLVLCCLCYLFIYLFDIKETIITSSTQSPTTLGVWVLICVVVLWDCVLRH